MKFFSICFFFLISVQKFCSNKCFYKNKQVRSQFLPNIYLFKVNNRNTRKRCEICLKLTIEIPERRHRRRSVVFIVNFEHISHVFLVFLLLLLTSKC